MATRLISPAKRSTDKQRLSTLPQLEKASRLMTRAAAVFIEGAGADRAVRLRGLQRFSASTGT
ncbi:hypothetical protein [Kribbella sp. NPDC023855]|uniref:hypothetical protein n=1 Tax=Kribbella sp. NPDC023855 TaxID=3154698 RepID=UPI00340A41E1